MEENRKLDENSFLFWYDKIVNLVNTPKTFVIQSEEFINTIKKVAFKRIKPEDVAFDYEEVKQLKLPLFIKTDLIAAKHRWVNTCYCDKYEDIVKHLAALYDWSFTSEIPVSAFVFREFLKLKTYFCCFDGMPIAKEFRYFAKKGNIICRHPYWPKEALEEGFLRNKMEVEMTGYRAYLSEEVKRECLENNKFLEKCLKPENFETIYEELCKFPSYKKLKEMDTLVETASNEFENAYSLDVCESEDGQIYLTDMALAKESYHEELCPFAEKLYSEQM